MRGADISARTRLDPEARRRQICETAELMLLEIGCLPIPQEELAGQAGVSKALIYRYFPTQEVLFNEVLALRLSRLRDLLPSEPKGVEGILDATREYFDDVRKHGPTIRFILRDPFLRNKLDDRCRDCLREIRMPLIGEISRLTGLPEAEAKATFNMIAAVPEEAGTRARSGDMSVSIARELCDVIVRAALSGVSKKKPKPIASRRAGSGSKQQ